ncbi:outer membrane protein assembly factor [Candidatus Neomarinimicrobiota bacterium]
MKLLIRLIQVILVLLAGAVMPLCAQSEEYPIDEIIVSGNVAYPDKDLLGLMKLRAMGRFGFRAQPFSRRALRIDALTVQGYYASHGYLEAAVRDSFVINDKGSITAYLNIHEGRQFKLADINISGNRLLTVKQIEDFLRLKRGQPYNPVRVRNRLDQLILYYHNQGKLTVDILDQAEAIDDIYLTLLISEGLTYTIRNVTIEGLEKISEKHINRELRFKSGDIYNKSRLVASQQRIFESGLFSGVEILPVISGEETGITDIRIQVRELGSRSIDLTFGFRQTEEPGVDEPQTAIAAAGEWWHSRILRSSIRSGISVETDLILQNITSPNLLTSWEFVMPWTLGIRVTSSLKFFSDYNTSPDEIWVKGVELSFRSKRLRRYQLRGGVRWEQISADPSVLDTVSTKGANRSLTVDYQYQGVDNLIQPTEGIIFQINPTIKATFVEKVKYYYSLEMDFRQYRPLFWNIVFAWRVKASYLETYPPGKGQHLLPIDLFDLGGSTSLRGWTKPERFTPKGGTSKWLANIELRIPLFWIIGMEVFHDRGSLRTFSPLRPDEYFWESGSDSGVGLLVTTPLGPIRLDAAWAHGTASGKPILQAAFLYTF